MTQFIERNRREVDLDRIITAIHYARSEAVKHNRVVILEAISGAWSNGQVICIDRNLDNHCGQDERRIRQFPPLRKHAHLQWHGFLSSHALRFSPSGSGKTLAGRFDYHLGVQHYRVIVNRIGRVRVAERKQE